MKLPKTKTKTNEATEIAETNGKRSVYKSQEGRILEELARLGGMRVQNDTLRFEGNSFIIPERMTVTDAIEYLDEWRESQEEYNSFIRAFNYKPWDGAHATQTALQKFFGTSGIGKATFSFFGGKQPPQMRTIEVGVGKTTQVPWGVVAVPMLGNDATLMFGVSRHEDYGMIFQLAVECPKKHKEVVEGLFRLVEEELNTNSIYRGKAIDGKDMPGFIDLAGVDPRKVIYSEDVGSQLDANVWSLLRHTDTMRDMGLPLKRSVLLEGPYGTGKTLALFLTGQIAVANGWTFLYCRPGQDDLYDVMGTARLYQPSVVCFEDVDTVSSGGEDDHVSRLLDLFDGINAKGTEIVAVMTTNHPERIHRGMVRPGRLDSVIHIGALDKSGIQRMIETTIAETRRDLLDYDEIYKAMEGYLPAFAKEAIDRTVRYAIARSGGDFDRLATEDFVLAAEGLRPQLEMMDAAGEGSKADPMSEMLKGVVEKVVHNTGVKDLDGDQMFTLEKVE